MGRGAREKKSLSNAQTILESLDNNETLENNKDRRNKNQTTAPKKDFHAITTAKDNEFQALKPGSYGFLKAHLREVKREINVERRQSGLGSITSKASHAQLRPFATSPIDSVKP